MGRISRDGSDVKVDTSTNSADRIVLGMLGVSFVTLKLTGFIDWSWLWVTAPFWGMVVLPLLIVSSVAIITSLTAGGVAFSVGLFDWLRRKKNKK